MIDDKTYLVFVYHHAPRDPYKRHSDPHGEGSSADIFYDDNAPEKYNMSKSLINTENVIQLYHKFTGAGTRKTSTMYAIELPRSVKTHTGDIQYIEIDVTGHFVYLVTKKNAMKGATIPDGVPVKSINNKTNVEVLLVHRWYAIVGVPISSKDISHSTISNLI